MSSDSMITESGRKIEAQLENPIDNALIAVSDKLSPIFKKLNFTPNGITTLSAITGLGALYFLYQKDTTQFTIYFLISYFFDVMDGYYARKYDMITDEGDRFDHYKDMLFMAIGAYILYSQYNITNFPILIVVIIGLYFLSLIYLGCQEVITTKDKQSETLRFTKEGVSALSMNKNTCEQRMKILRWFGSGSMILVIILSVLYLNGDFESISNALGFSSESNIVPGSAELERNDSTSDNTFPSPNSSSNSNPNFSSSSENNFGLNPFRMDTFEPRVDIRNISPQFTRTDLNFINDLRNFGSTNIGSSTIGPYSSNMMVDRMIRD